MTGSGSISPARRLTAVAAAVVGMSALAVGISLRGLALPNTWNIVTTPNGGNALSSNVLAGITCLSQADCWAVGHYGAVVGVQQFTDQALIEHWDGTAWTVVPSADQNAGATLLDNDLASVSCVAAADCWAVGSYHVTAAGPWAPIWEHWDGTTWTTTTAVAGVQSDFHLVSVSCVAANACWAAGWRQSSGAAATTWVEQWNGSIWTDTASPADPGKLASISCAATVFCRAVGDTGGTPDQALIEDFGSSGWARTTGVPQQGAGANSLNGVSCASTQRCWAVGVYQGSGVVQNLLMSWNGSAWTIPADTTASDDNAPAARNNQLNSVSCVDPSTCYAVGSSNAGANTDTTLIDRFDGTAWSLVAATPNQTTTSLNLLNGVSCVSSTFCASAGAWRTQTPNDQTLVLMLGVSVATPTPAPTATASSSPASGVRGTTSSRISVPRVGDSGGLLGVGELRLMLMAGVALGFAGLGLAAVAVNRLLVTRRRLH